MTTPAANSAPPRPAMVLIGLGSNLRPETHVPFALRQLRARFTAVRVSTIYWTRPLKGLNQPPYANGVVAATTSLLPCQVKRALRELEDQAGRERQPGQSYAPRTLDLDLLAYGDGPVPELGLPDEELVERDFVLLPAAELCPDWCHPLLGKTLVALARELFPVPPNILGPVTFPLGG